MNHATIDFETRSEVDIKLGAYKYAESPTTTILSLAYNLPGDVFTELWLPDQPPPQDLIDYIYLGGLVEAHNSFFEHCIWNMISPWPRMPLHQWRCSMAKARACGIPGSLDLAGDALNLDIKKGKRGKYLIQKLCKPRKPSKNNPDKWVDDPVLMQELYEYNIRDVDTEIELSNSLPEMPQSEIDVWLLDQTINERGVFIDIKAVQSTLDILEQTIEKYHARLEVLSHGDITTGNQRDRIIKWCGSQGVELTGLTKDDVTTALKKDMPPAVKEVLTIRQTLGKTSTAKYSKMLNMMAVDGRVHEVLQYHKAITGRFSGAGVQVQNLPRPTVDESPEFLVEVLSSGSLEEVEAWFDNPFEAASSAIRSMIIAPPGKELISADYSSIEARVLLWLAGDEEGLEVFRRGECAYCTMASTIYRVPYEEIYNGYIQKDFEMTIMRAIGKEAVLGLGYQMGATKFHTTCASHGNDISEGFAKTVVDTFRTRFSKVVDLWNGLEEAARKAILHKGRAFAFNGLKFKNKGNFLLCKLPNGRCMYYPFPRLKMIKTPWGQDKLSIMYQTYSEGKWMEVSTYGGKFAEQSCQGTARDLVAEAMLRVESSGYPVIMSVHDEIVSEVPEGFGSVQEYCDIMCRSNPWATGIPVAATGWRGKRYRK